MAITPVTNFRPVRGQSITFSGRNNNYEQNIEYDNGSSHSSSMSGLRKVPVIVLMAMSPLTVPNTSAREISAPEPALVEAAMSAGVQQQQEPNIIGSPIVIEQRIGNANTQFHILKCDVDGDKRTIDGLAFAFYKDVPNSQDKMFLAGELVAISPNPINSNGDYLLLYDADGSVGSTERVCLITAKQGKAIMNVLNSSQAAVLRKRMVVFTDIIKSHGGASGRNPRSISGEANMYYSAGSNKSYYVQPENK